MDDATPTGMHCRTPLVAGGQGPQGKKKDENDLNVGGGVLEGIMLGG